MKKNFKLKFPLVVLKGFEMESEGNLIFCQVCGEEAKAFIYGAICCGGCAQFFRRSIREYITYRPCTKKQQCSILRSNRVNCQDCRFKKCIAVGMYIEAARHGHTKMREKDTILATFQKEKASPQERTLDAELEDIVLVLTTIVRAHEETCDYTKDKVSDLVEKARNQPVYTQCPPQLSCPFNPAQDILNIGASYSMEYFSKRFAPAINGVVKFAKRIPGFGILSEDDQLTLLKGHLLPKKSFCKDSNARILLNSMFDFAKGLNTLRLSDSEIGLFCAVVVTASDRPGLRNTDLVCKIHQTMKHILKKTVTKNNRKNPKIFKDLTKKIRVLRTLNTFHSEKLLNYKIESDNRRAAGAIDGKTDNSVNNQSPYTAIPHNIGSTYALVSAHPPCFSPEKDLRGTSLGQHRQHGGNTTGSEWSTTDSKDEHDLVGSPRSIYVDKLRNPVITSSFFSSKTNANEETWHTEANKNVVEYHHTLPKRALENTRSEHGSSSYDKSYFHDTPNKGHVYPKLRRVDSATDSASFHFRYHESSTTPKISVFSSLRSSVDDKLKDMDHGIASEKHNAIEDMFVLKRPLHEPAIISGNILINEACQHHKIIRAAPTDSGIESGKDRGPSTTPISVFSSPRSSVDEIVNVMDHDHASEKQEAIEDTPMLKRALQAPSITGGHMPMNLAYHHHKKFRAALTDSAISHFPYHGPSTTPTISSFSSPRSSVDEKVKDMDHDHASEKHEAIEDMHVSKRALKAPPNINPYNWPYPHHKKFRAARREAEDPNNPSQVSG